MTKYLFGLLIAALFPVQATAQVAVSPECDALHLAALQRPERMAGLIDAGVDVDCRDEYGYSALHVAAAAGRPDTVSALLRLGAAVNARDAMNITPLSLLLVTRPLAMSAELPAYDRTRRLLLDAGGVR